MKCIVSSAAYGNITDKAPYFETCDYIKKGKVKEFVAGLSLENSQFYNATYIEGDEKYIFEKLKEISDIVKEQEFILTFRDDGDIEAKIYDDYIE